VNTIEDVQREVDAHVRGGYDIIKFREVLDPSGRFTATSRGLALPVYRKLNEAAREAGIPLVGHAPVNLGLDALLETRQDLAHSGALSNIYFLPLASNPRRLVLTGAAFSTLQTTLINYELLRTREAGADSRAGGGVSGRNHPNPMAAATADWQSWICLSPVHEETRRRTAPRGCALGRRYRCDGGPLVVPGVVLP